jgi:heptosyltransferase-2
MDHPPSACRILVRGVNWLGDAVMSTPALLRLRERFPEAHITLLTPEKQRDLWLHHSAINETISFPAGESLLSVSRKLRAGDFDLALVLPNSPRSALEVWLAKIPQRIGYARSWRSCFLTRAIPPRAGAVEMHKRSVNEISLLIANAANLPGSSNPYPPSAHHLHHYLHLVAALGAKPASLAPRLEVTGDEVLAAQETFGLAAASNNRPLLALNPGAEYGPAKRWPVERFIAVAREIQRQTDCGWIILGSEADASLARQIQSAIGNRQSAIQNLAGRTSLRELMAVLKLSRLLLTNDTGPMHVAAALGTPVVVPFGSTSPELTGPGLPGDERHRLLKSDAPCSPCFRRECPIDFRCMHGINVERVVAEVAGILNR